MSETSDILAEIDRYIVIFKGYDIVPVLEEMREFLSTHCVVSKEVALTAKVLLLHGGCEETAGEFEAELDRVNKGE